MAEIPLVRGDLDGSEQTLSIRDNVLRWDDGENVKNWPLTEVKELEVRHYVGTVALSAVFVDDTELILLRGSLGNRSFYQDFAQTVNAQIKGTEAELREHRQDRCPKCNRLYPDPVRPICPKCLDKRSLFKRVLGLTPPYAKWVALMVVLMLASSAVGLLSPYVGGRVFFDETLKSGGKYAGKLGYVVLAMFAIQLLTLVINIFQGRVGAKVAAQIGYDLKTGVFNAMQNLSLRFYNQQQTGSLMTRVNNDAEHLQYFFHDGLPFFIVNALRLIGVIIILLALDWQLALPVLIPVPLIVFITVKVRPMLWRMYTKRWRASSRLNAVVNDSLSGMRVIKAFGREDAEIERFGRRNRRVYEVFREVGNTTSTVFPLLSYLMGIGALVIWGFGGWRVVRGDLTLGTLMTFTGYLGMLYGPLDFMTRVVEWWSSSMNSAQRIFEIIDSTQVLWTPEGDELVQMPELKGAVEARDVSFSYEEGKPILENISFKVEPGEMIGIVGRSGAGKSTLINLIARLYDPDQGQMFIDGVDLRYVSQADLRKQVGMVLQDTFLFRGTIFENIAYAKPDATPEEVMAAAKVANAHDFIIQLPDGYETVLGVRDVNLSGGERQRIAIARAVLHDPQILILDEATASIDIETERLVQEALERLVEGRTTFAIAHRLSTLRKANRLLVLDKGRLVEEGHHSELLQQKGIYHKLLTTQRKGLAHLGIDITDLEEVV
ncbi:MAG: ABC transporter transmembrane domain-containing protein [Limnochordia bacterium]